MDYLIHDMVNNNTIIITNAKSSNHALVSAADHWNMDLDEISGSDVYNLTKVTRKKAFAMMGVRAKKFCFLLRMSAVCNPADYGSPEPEYINQYNCMVKADSIEEAIESFNNTYHFAAHMKRHLNKDTTKTYLYQYKNGRPRGKKLATLNFKELYKETENNG